MFPSVQRGSPGLVCALEACVTRCDVWWILIFRERALSLLSFGSASIVLRFGEIDCKTAHLKSEMWGTPVSVLRRVRCGTRLILESDALQKLIEPCVAA